MGSHLEIVAAVVVVAVGIADSMGYSSQQVNQGR